MLAERAVIVGLEPSALWVETGARSTCGSCHANENCGTGLLQRYLQTSKYLRIELESDPSGKYRVGDELELGLDESVVVRGSLLLYVTPLVGLLLGAALGYQLGGEPLSIGLGVAGVVMAGLAVRWHAWKNRFNPDYHPVILDESAILSRSSAA